MERDNQTLVDVAVIGAGPHGLMYASWLKKARPELRVTVLERDDAPGHKIGESTLSGFCKALRTLGIRREAMERLFYPKHGLGFFFADHGHTRFSDAPEHILESFDGTYQVERRTLDSLIMENARRLGVVVLQGARVRPGESAFGAGENTLAYERAGQVHRLGARLVADASGPASLLGRHLSTYSQDVSHERPFQSSAIWGYFRNVRSLDHYPGYRKKAEASRDQYTQHICFREGWAWYIPIVSWERAPYENLCRLQNHLLASEGPLPDRAALAGTFACPVDDIVSVGIVVRDDRDEVFDLGTDRAFWHYVERLPLMRAMLEGAELLNGHYRHHNPFTTRRRFRRHALEPVGDGWLLIGDAAFFVDPLISPGLTGGAAGVYTAAQSTLGALDAGDLGRARFSGYRAFVRDLHEALERDGQLVYMSFNHPEAIALVQRFQEIDARRHFNDNQEKPYGVEDTNVWGLLHPDYQRMQKALWALMREAETEVGRAVPLSRQRPEHYDPMVRRMNDLLAGYIEENAHLTPYITNNRKEAMEDQLGRRHLLG